MEDKEVIGRSQHGFMKKKFKECDFYLWWDKWQKMDEYLMLFTAILEGFCCSIPKSLIEKQLDMWPDREIDWKLG